MGYVAFLLLIAVGEVVFHLVFAVTSRLFAFEVDKSARWREAAKGILERIMLSFGVAHGVITVIIAFAALKVATKISLSSNEADKGKIARHNDYFIVGNVLSIFFALSYAILARKLGLVTAMFEQ